MTSNRVKFSNAWADNFIKEYDEVSILADLDEILDSEIELNKIGLESKSKNPKDRRNQISRSSSALNYARQSPRSSNRYVTQKWHQNFPRQQKPSLMDHQVHDIVQRIVLRKNQSCMVHAVWTMDQRTEPKNLTGPKSLPPGTMIRNYCPILFRCLFGQVPRLKLLGPWSRLKTYLDHFSHHRRSGGP